MHNFDGEVIPGLLQTEQYSRQVHEVAAHLVKTEEVDRLVAARAHRQERLTDESSPLELRAVVSEAAFRRAMGDAALPRRESASKRRVPVLVEVADPRPHRDPGLEGQVWTGPSPDRRGRRSPARSGPDSSTDQPVNGPTWPEG
jgi:hypothetical protein